MTAKIENCTVEQLLEIIGGKWRIPIIWHLSKHPTIRYNALKRELNGITNTMLTRCLLELEERNLIIRKKVRDVPPHVDYYLAEEGKKLIPVLEALNRWGEGYLLSDNDR